MNYGSSKQRSLYFAAPQFIKEAIATAYGMQQRRTRYGNSFREALALLRDTEYRPNDELREQQHRLAAAFVDEALEDTQYYRNNPEYSARWRAGNISQLPVMRKEQVRSHLSELYSDRRSAMPHRWQHTSGTTGKSLIFPIALPCFQREHAFRAFHYNWAGVDILKHEPVAFCQGHPVTHYDRTEPPFWAHDHANNFLYLSSYHLAQANLPAYCKELDRFAPIMLSGYPSSLYLLANAYRTYGSGRLKLRAVYTTSETLLDFQRTAIIAAFGCRVFDWYGNSEMCANIVECEHGEYHLKLEHSVVEVLDSKNRPVAPGGTGRMVCTGFGNFAFPLIRYEIGDVVTLSTSQVSRCGRGGLLIERVLGRLEDYVVGGDGRLVGRLDHLFKDCTNVVEAQIVQREPGTVILRIVKNDSYASRDERTLREEAALRLGSETKVSFEYVTTIPRTSNGKFRFIESSLDQKEFLALAARSE
jgi:phenylacetate-CoA ligase